MKAAAVAACLCVLAAACLCVSLSKAGKPADFAEADGVGRYSLKAENTARQEEFLSQFGLKARTASKKTDRVTIPKKWNEVYENYNKLQKIVGLDLEKLKGREVERVVFKLENSEKYAVLLIWEGRVVGGHLSTGIYGEGYESLNGKTG